VRRALEAIAEECGRPARRRRNNREGGTAQYRVKWRRPGATLALIVIPACVTLTPKLHKQTFYHSAGQLSFG
jgi:hypothetical protein